MTSSSEDIVEDYSDDDLIEEQWGNSWDLQDICSATVSSNSGKNKTENVNDAYGGEVTPGASESLTHVCNSGDGVCLDNGQKKTVENESSPLGSPVERMALNDHKAGMQGLDREKINKIIHEASKGSQFYENEKRKEERVKERIANMKTELARYSKSDMLQSLSEADAIVKSLSQRLDLSRTLVHIDMDAFYAAVEMRDNPKLREVPMAVGGMSMLSTSNYIARRFGVRAGMPGFIAKKLCPELVLVPGHFDKYKAVSAQIRDIFSEYDPNFSPMSLDEAYLDITDYMTENAIKYSSHMVCVDISYEEQNIIQSLKQGHSTSDQSKCVAELIVEEIRSRIHEVTQLTASAGIAPNMMLSKICSDMNKPNGQYFLRPDAEVVANFVNALPIRKVFGIGKVSEQILKAFGVDSCRDLYVKRDVLQLLFSRTSFEYFMRVAHGISSNHIEHEDRKSMSTERTFHDTSDVDDLIEICRNLCSMLEKDLAKEKLQGTNITLKVKLASFEIKSRSKTLGYPVSSAADMFPVARDLLFNEMKNASKKPLTLRLMGVRVSDFVGKTAQRSVLNFFTKSEKKFSVDMPNDLSKKHSLESKADPGAPSERISTDLIDSVPNQSTSDVKESKTSESRVACPVCGHMLKNDIAQVNEHVDKCLTKQTIKEIVKQENVAASHSSPSKSGARQKRRLVDHPGCTSSKKATLYSFWNKSR